MPLMSMTGFGAARFQVGAQNWRFEMKSVNHKGCFIRLNLPDALSHLENALQQKIRDRLLRGSIQGHLKLEDDQRAYETHLDLDGLQALAEPFKAAAKTLSLPAPSLIELIGLGDFLRQERAELDPQAFEEALFAALDEALEAMVRDRQREGSALRDDLHGRLLAIEAMLDQSRTLAPQILEAMRDKLRERVSEELKAHDQPIDEARLATEMVLLANKSDITEELVRAEAHIAAFMAIIDDESDAERGRRLDFLSQEILREINTLGSKCRDAGIVGQVVDTKVELEKIREQIQNIA